MSIKITSLENSEQLILENPLKIEGTADDRVMLVRVSSPIGNTDFLLGNTVVVDGKWSLSYQFTLGGDRKIVAEGFDRDNNEITEDKITVNLISVEDISTDLVTISSPTNGSDFNLEETVNFTGKLSGDVKKN